MPKGTSLHGRSDVSHPSIGSCELAQLLVALCLSCVWQWNSEIQSCCTPSRLVLSLWFSSDQLKVCLQNSLPECMGQNESPNCFFITKMAFLPQQMAGTHGMRKLDIPHSIYVKPHSSPDTYGNTAMKPNHCASAPARISTELRLHDALPLLLRFGARRLCDQLLGRDFEMLRGRGGAPSRKSSNRNGRSPL